MQNLFRGVIFGFAAIVFGTGAASAQVTGVGYAFGSPGFATCNCSESQATFHAGGGGEVRFGDLIGVGSDVGYIGPFKYFSEGVGLLSVNGTYYLPRTGRDRKLQPFATAGYSLAFRDGTANLWNAGAGVDYWTTGRVGVRVEIRDHIIANMRDTQHLWGPRIGVVIKGK